MLIEVLTEGWRTDVRVIEKLRSVERVSADYKGFTLNVLLFASLEVLHLYGSDLLHSVFLSKMQFLGQCLS